MTDYLNYTTGNITSLPDAMRYAASVFQVATGMDMFFGFLVMCFYAGAFIMSEKFGFERAFSFASFFGLICAVLLVWAGLLNPIWILMLLVFTGISLFIGW